MPEKKNYRDKNLSRNESSTNKIIEYLNLGNVVEREVAPNL